MKLEVLGLTAGSLPTYLVNELSVNMSQTALGLFYRNASKAKTFGDLFEFTWNDFFDPNATFDLMLNNAVGIMLSKSMAHVERAESSVGKTKPDEPGTGRTEVKPHSEHEPAPPAAAAHETAATPPTHQANGHEYKIREDGQVIRCSDNCATMKNRLAALALNDHRAKARLPELTKQLEDIETIADPVVKKQKIAEFDHHLDVEFAAPAGGQSTGRRRVVGPSGPSK
jgi:hypothetical protein